MVACEHVECGILCDRQIRVDRLPFWPDPTVYSPPLDLTPEEIERRLGLGIEVDTLAAWYNVPRSLVKAMASEMEQLILEAERLIKEEGMPIDGAAQSLNFPREKLRKIAHTRHWPIRRPGRPKRDGTFE